MTKRLGVNRAMHAAGAFAVAIGLAGCGSSAGSSSIGGMAGMGAPDPHYPGMSAMATGDGLSQTGSGLTFKAEMTGAPAGKSLSYPFQIQASDGAPVTRYSDDQTKLMHFYVIRSDLTGFQHVHPTMSHDGTWTAPVAALRPGRYRTYASFIAHTQSGEQVPLTLGNPLSVPGAGADVNAALPPASPTSQVDGYTVSVGDPQLVAGMSHTLTVTITKDGKPVTDLQPYLATYAHLTAFRQGNLAFAHLHPQGSVNASGGGGPTLKFEAMLPQAGNWRLFLQFRTGNALHTAAITLAVG
jgi:hypothetical protein